MLTFNSLHISMSLLTIAPMVAKASTAYTNHVCLRPSISPLNRYTITSASCQNQLFLFRSTCRLSNFTFYLLLLFALCRPTEKMISFLVHFVRQHFLIICCCVITALVWPNLRMHLMGKEQSLPSTSTNSETTIRLDELAKFDGIQNDKLYLSILGSVFDVTKGVRHYKSGETYNYFVGKY